jgi:hypothetical protein
LHSSHLAGAHALQIDVAFLVGDSDRQQLPRHLLDRHVHAFGGIAAQGAFFLPVLVVLGEFLVDLGKCAVQRDPPAFETVLAGQPQPEFGTGRPRHRRPHPFVAEFFEDRVHLLYSFTIRLLL